MTLLHSKLRGIRQNSWSAIWKDYCEGSNQALGYRTLSLNKFPVRYLLIFLIKSMTLPRRQCIVYVLFCIMDNFIGGNAKSGPTYVSLRGSGLLHGALVFKASGYAGEY